jgi:hypothetical protein
MISGVQDTKENAMKRQIFLVLILMLAATACGSKAESGPVKTLEDYRMFTNVPEASDLTATAESELAASIPPPDCPVTLPSEPLFKAPEPYFADAPWPGIFWFGQEHLWTALQENGVWDGLPHTEQGYTQKIMWWSSLYVLKDELEPALVVTGRRLDAEAPPLKSYGATNASAKDIGDAMLIGVDFPTEGCWEVTGQYKKSGLTFVVWIVP